MAEDLPEVPFVHVSYNPAEGLTLAGPAADDSAPDDSVPHITSRMRGGTYDSISAKSGIMS